MKLRPFALFLLILTAALLCLCPAVLQLGIKTGYDIAAGNPSEYRGRLTLWQIDGEAQSNSFIAQVCDEFEKNNVYVFITIENLTSSAAREKLNEGEHPDLISFGRSFGPIDALTPARLDEGTDLVTPYGHYAIPYAADAYCLFVNEDILAQNDLDSADAADYSARDIRAAGAKCQDTQGEAPVYGLGGNLMPLTYMPETKSILEGQPLLTPSGTPEDFAAGNLALYIGPASFSRQLINSNSLNWSAYAKFLYTDLIRYIGICGTDNELKNAMCEKFVNTVLSVKNQKRILSKNLICARDAYEDFNPLDFFEDDVLLECYELLINGGVIDSVLD